jgi:hypothetical protein
MIFCARLARIFLTRFAEMIRGCPGGLRSAPGRAALLAAGMSVREVAEEIGIAKSVVRRMKQKIEREAKDEEGQPGGG